jgi:anti-anti-sigma factor
MSAITDGEEFLKNPDPAGHNNGKGSVWLERGGKTSAPVINIGGLTLPSNTTRIMDSVAELMDKIKGDVILDLKNCTYMSSMALGTLAKVAIKRKESGWRMFIVAANKKILNIIEMIGIDEFVTICDTREEANILFVEQE